jgi:hypothetical protein
MASEEATQPMVTPTRCFSDPVAASIGGDCLTDPMAVTIYGVCAVTFMMAMYALESRGPRYVLAFAFGCVLSSVYGFLSGAWPFGIVELIWSAIAVRRYRTLAH